jgi:site-specific DNA recombinase
VDIVVDHGASGRTTERPGLQRVLATLDRGEAAGVVVAKLDRLTRSVRDIGALLERSEEGGWSLSSVAEQLDTRTASGRLVLNILVSVAQWEREAISDRTKAALAVKRAQGVRLGRPPEPLEDRVLRRVCELREEGRTYEAIAAACQEEGLPTPRGGQWHPTTVARLLRRVT